MARILVVYYSLTGHTRQVATSIAQACGADIEPILDVAGRQPKPSDLFWLGLRALLHRAEDIREPKFDPANYDMVIIGTPVWAGNMASPVRTYVTRYQGKLKRLALFCTEGGANGDRALGRIAQMLGLVPSAQLIITEPELASGAHGHKIDEFVASLDLPKPSADTHQSAA